MIIIIKKTLVRNIYLYTCIYMYRDKYLKYKKKYLNLKESLIQNQDGGAFPFRQGDGSKFSIMAKIEDDTLDRINERLQK